MSGFIEAESRSQATLCPDLKQPPTCVPTGHDVEALPLRLAQSYPVLPQVLTSDLSVPPSLSSGLCRETCARHT